jgi:hypothetical protein
MREKMNGKEKKRKGKRREGGYVQCFYVFQQQWQTQMLPDSEPPPEGEQESNLFLLPSENYESSFFLFCL